VVGAILGDGYLFRSSEGYLVGLDVRNKDFADRFAANESATIGSPVRAHYYTGNRIWFVRIRNYSLFSLIYCLRESPSLIPSELADDDQRLNATQFVSGFFDAEGCIKVVKEKTRRTGKICLDITNTRKVLLDIFNSLVEGAFGFSGRFSCQDDTRDSRKRVFHLRYYKKAHACALLSVLNSPKLTRERKRVLDEWVALGAEPLPSPNDIRRSLVQNTN
jgi:hypothetical protein